MIKGILLWVLAAMLIFFVGQFMWTKVVPGIRSKLP